MRSGSMSVDQPDRSAASGRRPPQLAFVVTPVGAFAAAALVVAGLALAVALGRQYQHRVDNHRPPAELQTGAGEQGPGVSALEAVRRRPPLHYDQLEVDRGTAE